MLSMMFIFSFGLYDCSINSELNSSVFGHRWDLGFIHFEALAVKIFIVIRPLYCDLI